MHYKPLTILFFILIWANSAHAVIKLRTEQGQIDLYDKSYALVIGVSDYKYWPDLPGVRDDVKAVKSVLKEQGFIVHTLSNPSRREFDDTMRAFISDYGQDEQTRLLVYFAGHGYTLTTKWGRELGYIIPRDAPLPSKGVGPLKRKAISMLEIEIYAKQIEAKHALFMFDSCFSGSLFGIMRAVPAAISIKTERPVRQFITAGAADQEVPDKSIFRRQFVAGLKGHADMNRDGYITGTELAQFLEYTVTNYTMGAQTPQYGKIRDPILDKGDFVFISPGQNAPDTKVTYKPQIDPLAIELTYWQTIKGRKHPALYQAYLEKYPQGQFASLAKTLRQDSQQRIEALAIGDDMVAMIAPAYTISGKTVVVAPRGETKPAWKIAGQTKYTRQVGATVIKSLNKYLDRNSKVKISIDSGNNSRLKYENDKNYPESRAICRNKGGDIVIAGMVNVIGKHNQPLFELSYFDCRLKKKLRKEYQLSVHSKDSHRFEISMTQAVTHFMGNYVQIFSEILDAKPQAQLTETPKTAPHPEKKREKKRVIPRW